MINKHTFTLFIFACILWGASYLLALPAYNYGDGDITGFVLGLMSFGTLVGGFIMFVGIVISWVKESKFP